MYVCIHVFMYVYTYICVCVGGGEFLCADNLALIVESLPEQDKVWKQGLESKGLRVNVAKAKVLVSRKANSSQTPSGRWHCSICRKGVGRNSIRCTQCKLWTHKRCSNIKGRLTRKVAFVCSRCTGAINTADAQKTDSITCQGGETSS
uniref:Zinc finger PHD-type domain-containing protein n=1 Tax=Octopus bimaculoides TaxID=37653 RepID=A0A0L8HH12_OCTBM